MDKNISYSNISTSPFILRLGSFIIDIITSEFLFVLILFLFNSPSKIQELENNAVELSKSTSSFPTIILYFILWWGIYYFLQILFFKKTIGMKVTGLHYVTSDDKGNPKKITLMQKILRSLFYAGSLFLGFIPLIPFPFDKYHRSVVDFISNTFVISIDSKKKYYFFSYFIIIVFIVLIFTRIFSL